MKHVVSFRALLLVKTKTMAKSIRSACQHYRVLLMYFHSCDVKKCDFLKSGTTNAFLTLKISNKVIHDVVSNELIHNNDTGHNKNR